jgi:hypothetical protein
LRAWETARAASIETGSTHEDAWQADRLRCIFGNPFHPLRTDAEITSRSCAVR